MFETSVPALKQAKYLTIPHFRVLSAERSQHNHMSVTGNILFLRFLVMSDTHTNAEALFNPGGKELNLNTQMEVHIVLTGRQIVLMVINEKLFYLSQNFWCKE